MTKDQLRKAIQSCCEEHAHFVKNLRRKYQDDIITESICVAIASLVTNYIEKERVDLSPDRLESISHELLTNLQNATDDILKKYAWNNESR